jgi:tyrosyl-tRNA synthetase
LLQANDYLELAKRHGCTVQIGGSDQWGNIVSGMDLVRRQLGGEAYALTVPLIAKADGTKFGKTAAGAIWLDPAKTSPYAFYQFWLNSADDDVIKFLKVFTFMALDEIVELEAAVQSDPQSRTAQLRLAEQVTELVHGSEALRSARRISECLFGGRLDTLTESDLEQLKLDGMDCTQLAGDSLGLLSAAAESGLAPSRGAARKLVQSKGLSVNGVVQGDAERDLDWSDALFGRFYLLRRGKKNWHLLVRDRG